MINSEADVLCNGVRKQEDVLGHVTYGCPEAGQVKRLQGLTVHFHDTIRGVIEAGHELCQGGFSAARSADHGQGLPRFEVEAQAVQCPNARIRIGEANILEGNPTFDFGRGLCRVRDAGFHLEKGIDAGLAGRGFLNQRGHPAD